MKNRWLGAMVICTALISGCSDSDEPISLEPDRESVTFSILYNEREASPIQEDWLILSEYEERRNVRFEVETGSDSTYGAVLDYTLSGDEIPDIVLKVWPDQARQYAIDGVLLPISDYVDRMPYFQAYITEHDLEDELDRQRLPNGKFYVLPGFQRPIQVQQWIYRRDLFNEHDLGVPTTFTGMRDALEELKELYPDSTPITASWSGAHLFSMIGAAYGTTAGWDGTRAFDPQEDRWRYAPATDRYRAMVQYLHNCHRIGVLDPALFTQTNEEFMEKVTTGDAFFIPTWITSGFDGWNRALRNNGISAGEWAPIPVPESVDGLRKVPAVSRFRKGLVLPARIAAEPYRDRLIEFLDWAVYSEEGMTLTAWGVEGVTYAVDPETTERSFLPSIRTPRNLAGTLDLTADFGCNTLFDLNEDEAFEDYKKPEAIVAFLERSVAAGETTGQLPPLHLPETVTDAVGAVEPTVAAYANEMLTRFIAGDVDPSSDTEWNAYLTEMEARGYRTIEEIWNRAWQTGSN